MDSLDSANLLISKLFSSVLEEETDDKRISRINHKMIHSYSVFSAAQRIIVMEEQLRDISEDTKKKAEVASLLHDVGKFHNSGKRKEQGDHGDRAFDKLNAEGEYSFSVMFAAKYHNKKDINGLYYEDIFQKRTFEQREEVLQILKIVRDADKLQHLEGMMFSGDLFEKDFDEKTPGKVSEEFITAMKEQRTADKQSVQTSADKALMFFCWIFDMNFSGSLEILSNYGFLSFFSEGVRSLGVEENVIQLMEKSFQKKLDSFE